LPQEREEQRREVKQNIRCFYSLVLEGLPNLYVFQASKFSQHKTGLDVSLPNGNMEEARKKLSRRSHATPASERKWEIGLEDTALLDYALRPPLQTIS
jgi:hypothetical protein